MKPTDELNTNTELTDDELEGVAGGGFGPIIGGNIGGFIKCRYCGESVKNNGLYCPACHRMFSTGDIVL